MDDLARREVQKCALASHRITFEHRRDPVKINGKLPEAARLDISHTRPIPPSATRPRVQRRNAGALRCRKVQTWRHARHFCCALAHLPEPPIEIVVSTSAEVATTRWQVTGEISRPHRSGRELDKIDQNELRELITDSWLIKAPAKLRRQFDEQ